jgi:hypothetical protein
MSGAHANGQSKSPQLAAADEHALRERVRELKEERDALKQKLRARADTEETQAQALLRLAKPAETWRTPGGELFATFRAEGCRRTSRLREGAFRGWLRLQFYEEQGKPPGSQALQDAIDTLASQAELEGEVREASLRVAGSAFGAYEERRIYVDLGTEEWSAAEVTPDDWEITRSPNARFRRPGSARPLPTPMGAEGGAHPLGRLREHVRPKSGEDLALLLAWMVQALRPAGPYPILVLTGEQGSGKTSTMKMVRSLVDPSRVPTRSAPRQEEDLIVAAENSWVLALDNLSGISPWLSDALCRLATGGGFGTRQHYTNREEATFYHKRPVILNGIEDLTARPDLADRALVIELESIPESERKSERELWEDFSEDRPVLFKGLLDALATALRLVGEAELEKKPRMVDFAEWSLAAEPAFPTEPGTFEAAYAENREKANETALRNDPIARAILQMLEEEGEWKGKTSELRQELKGRVPDPSSPPAELASYQALGSHLKRIMPVLREAGVEREEDPRSSCRAFTLRLSGEEGAPF